MAVEGQVSDILPREMQQGSQRRRRRSWRVLSTTVRAVTQWRKQWQRGVYLYAYDFTQDFCNYFSKLILGKQFVLAGHTAVVAYGSEYYIQDWRGPTVGEPGQCFPSTKRQRTPSHKFYLGTTERSKTELEQHIDDDLRSSFEGKYNRASNNCNHYADKVCLFLIDKGLPDVILKGSQHAEEVLLENRSDAALMLLSFSLPCMVLAAAVLITVVLGILHIFFAMSGVVDKPQLHLYFPQILNLMATLGFLVASCRAFCVRARGKRHVFNLASTTLALVLEIFTKSPSNTLALMTLIVIAIAGPTSLCTSCTGCNRRQRRISPDTESLLSEPLLPC
mmetsp:Transcript_68181/g.121541  ORF Transcript_68181/g.121541 Transcript_68181/m.121541 type:complete len:335 (-) Transcript_68181:91-1095(-)